MTKRLYTLDIFRGLTALAMILVNNPGNWNHIYPPLRHAQWHGCTPTDLIFPFFLIIVGISIGYSSQKYNHILSWNSFYRIGKRSLILLILGILLNAFPFYQTDYSQLRIPGVLQRIGVSYFFASVLILTLSKRQLILSGCFILIAYHILFLIFGGDTPYVADGNIVQKFDLWVFGSQHLWQGLGFPFDPEGILSTLPAISSILIGYLIFNIIHKSPTPGAMIKTLLIFAVLSLCISLLWSLSFPINKSLWSSSYVLYSASWALFILAGLIYIIEIKEFKQWAIPFEAFGTNPLFLYVLAWILSVIVERMIWIKPAISLKQWLYTSIASSWLNNAAASLVYALLFVLCIWLCGWLLYRRKIFIKI